MCGITGFAGTTEEDPSAVITRMANALRHRGPDDSGTWIDAAHNIAFGHRRLSILDLSPEGHQPMHSASGRWVISYNGEIYNFAEMREELQARGATFRGTSDTEIFLAAVEAWGPVEALKRSNGMFAIALWDAKEQILYLARDRLGIKPLYIGWLSGQLVFASELKSLCVHPAFQFSVDNVSLTSAVYLGFIAGGRSIYQNITQLTPGTVYVVPCAGGRPSKEKAQRISYWSLIDLASKVSREPRITDAQLAVEQLHAVLKDSVRKQMVADVPVGAFLSGGVDSSAVVALMQDAARGKVKTFSVGFDNPLYNELEYARAVASELGTDHTELMVSAREAMEVIPELPQMFDEPFADPSQIPTFLVSRLARQSVTVALSGDGGDELFMGYNRYRLPDSVWRKIRNLPLPLRKLAKTLLLIPSPVAYDNFYKMVERMVPRSLHLDKPGERVQRLAQIVDAADVSEMYERLLCHSYHPANLLTAPASLGIHEALGNFSVLTDIRERCMLFDQSSYLVDDLLTKLDRVSMQVSLEARVPILDHRVVELAARIATALKDVNGQSKWPLRQVLAKYISPKHGARPKMGFSVPIGDWLCGGLKDWANDLLAETALSRYGYFNVKNVRSLWHEHLSGRRNWQQQLWNVLMVQSWLFYSRQGR